MSKLLQYMQVVCLGEMAGLLVLALGAWDTLACAVAAIVSVLFSRLIDEEKIRIAPTVDAVEVVRCRECRSAQQLKTSADQVYCMVWGKNPRIDGYCYLGAKMDGGAADGSE